MVEGANSWEMRKVWNSVRSESRVVADKLVKSWPGSLGASWVMVKKAVKRRREESRRLAVAGGVF